MAYLLAFQVLNHDMLFEMNKNGSVQKSRCDLRLRLGLEDVPNSDKENVDNPSLTSGDVFSNSVSCLTYLLVIFFFTHERMK